MIRDEIHYSLEKLDDGRWLVTITRNGDIEQRVTRSTQAAAIAYAEAQKEKG